MTFQHFAQQLRERLSHPLPGETAQFKMAPARRLTIQEYYDMGNRNPRKSAVLVCCYPLQSSIFITLMLRPSLQGIHSDQVSFPGGRFEEGDANLETTALREAYEELGIDPHSIEVVGEMSSIYIPVSNSLVHPFLGVSEKQPAFKPNPLEVKEIIETELKTILDPLARGIALFPGIGNSTIEAPYYKIGQYQVWGATAMILSEMEAIIADLDGFGRP